MNLLAITITFLLPLLCLAVPILFYLYRKQRTWSQAISQANASTPRVVCAVEMCVLAILVTVLVINLATSDGSLYFRPLPPAVIRARAVICTVATLIGVLFLALSYFRSRIAGSLGVIVAALAGTIYLNSSEARPYQIYKDAILQMPVPVEIKLRERVPDVDVIINGVKMGQAPLQTTLEEIMAKAPPIEFDEKEEQKTWVNIGSGTYLRKVRILLDRCQEVDIQTGAHDEKDDKFPIVVQLERHGEPVRIAGSYGWSGGSRMFGQIQTTRIPLGAMTDGWYRDATTLLEQARYRGYRVDADWVNAAETYHEIVRDRIWASIETEPQFRQVLNDWAAIHYGIKPGMTADAAWQTFTAICEEANRADEYRMNSTAGEAVDLLLDDLDIYKLVAATMKRLNEFALDGQHIMGWSWSTLDGKVSFGTSPTDQVSSLKPSDFVLAHAVVHANQKLNAHSAGTQNPIHQKIAPRLMQFGYYNPQVRGFALALGGPLVAEFEQRQQRDVWTFEPSSDFTKNEFIEGKHVLGAAWSAVNRNDSLGAHFRRLHQDQAVEFAKKMLNESFLHGSELPSWMNFLFLNVEDRPPLGRDFWKTFNRSIDTKDHIQEFALNFKWNYLARLGPHAEIDEFIAAFPSEQGDPGSFFNARQSLIALSDDRKFDVIVRTLDKAKSAQNLMTKYSDKWSKFQQVVYQLESLLPTIPNSAAADRVMSDFQMSAAELEQKGAERTVRQLSDLGRLTPPLFQRLAESSDAKLRLMVLPQIRLIPTPENRDVLKKLIQDDDESVRTAAQKVADELEAFARLPLPRLNS